MTTEPVVTTRLSLGDAVELAVAGRRTAQTAAARRTTGVVVVVVAWLIDGGALIVRAAQDRHQLLQLTCKLVVVVVDVVSSSCVRLTAFRDSVIDDLFIHRSKPPPVQRWARSSSL